MKPQLLAALAVLALTAVPGAAANCWDYDCPASQPGYEPEEDETTAGYGSGFGTDPFGDEQGLLDEEFGSDSEASDAGFPGGWGWLGMWAGILLVAIIAAGIIGTMATRRAPRIGNMGAAAGLTVGAILLGVSLATPLISEEGLDIGFWGMTVFGEHGYWDEVDDFPGYNKGASQALAIAAGPLVALGTLMLAIGAIVAWTRRRHAGLLVAGGLVALVGLVSFNVAAVLEEWTDAGWGAAWYLAVVGILVAASSQLARFADPDPRAQAAAQAVGAAQPAPADAAYGAPAAMGAAPHAQGGTTQAPAYGAAPEPAAPPASRRLRCPRCQHVNHLQAGQPVQCSACGLRGPR